MRAISGAIRIVRRLAIAATGIAVLTSTVPLSAETGQSAWKQIEFPGIAPSKFVHADENRIDVISDRSSAMLYRALEPGERARRYLGWVWRVDAG